VTFPLGSPSTWMFPKATFDSLFQWRASYRGARAHDRMGSSDVPGRSERAEASKPSKIEGANSGISR